MMAHKTLTFTITVETNHRVKGIFTDMRHRIAEGYPLVLAGNHLCLAGRRYPVVDSNLTEKAQHDG
jgi:hypothetical protein